MSPMLQMKNAVGLRRFRGSANRSGWSVTFSVAFPAVRGFVVHFRRLLSASA
jgi:hypothetical protein